MANFLSGYKSIAKNSDISARVDVLHKRLYAPKRFKGVRISVNSKGSIIECKDGALVNNQGFASIAKLSAKDISALAKLINK